MSADQLDTLKRALEPLLGPLARMVADELRPELQAIAGAAQGPTMSVREAARLLGCSERTVRQRVSVGRLRATKAVPGGSSRLRIERASVEQLLREGAL